MLFLSVLAGVAPVAAAGAATPSPDPPPLAVAPDLPGQADPRTVQAPAVQAAPATVEPTQVTPRPAVAVVTPRVAMTPPDVAPPAATVAPKAVTRPAKRTRPRRVAQPATPKVVAEQAPPPRATPRDRPLLPRLAAAAVVRAEPLDRRLLALGGSLLALAALGGAVVLVAGRQALRELAA